MVMCNLIVRTPKNTYIYKHKDDKGAEILTNSNEGEWRVNGGRRRALFMLIVYT